MTAQTHITRIRAAARILSDRQADLCHVDREDQWKEYHADFCDDAEAAMTAVLSFIDQQQAEIGRLKSELSRPMSTEATMLIDVNMAQAAEIERLRADAARYQYLKQFSRAASLYIDGNHCWTLRPPHRLHVFLRPTFEEAIDAAMKETP